jgi:hypothetical protein
MDGRAHVDAVHSLHSKKQRAGCTPRDYRRALSPQRRLYIYLRTSDHVAYRLRSFVDFPHLPCSTAVARIRCVPDGGWSLATSGWEGVPWWFRLPSFIWGVAIARHLWRVATTRGRCRPSLNLVPGMEGRGFLWMPQRQSPSVRAESGIYHARIMDGKGPVSDERNVTRVLADWHAPNVPESRGKHKIIVRTRKTHASAASSNRLRSPPHRSTHQPIHTHTHRTTPQKKRKYLVHGKAVLLR